MVTIKELAQELGVSPSTVSIVLNGKAEERKISAATREEVLRVAARRGPQTKRRLWRRRVANRHFLGTGFPCIYGRPIYGRCAAATGYSEASGQAGDPSI